MNRDRLVYICLAYILGLLATGFWYFELVNPPWAILSSLGLLVLGLLLISILSRRLTGRTSGDLKLFAIALCVGILAMAYFWFKLPQPTTRDISYFISEKSQPVQVSGKVTSEPRLNQNYKLRFWLDCQELKLSDMAPQDVSGKLYVTMPLLVGDRIQLKQQITITGNLYKPQPATKPGEFDFARYLRERTTFAALSSSQVIHQGHSNWGWHRLRQKIIRTQVKALGSPLGQLMSSVVLGRRAVDLPTDIYQLFVASGLAHILAASGFHVSLLLGFVLRLTERLYSQQRLIIGILTLLVYSCLTGFSASIIRASLMGIAVLTATVNQAKIRPLGALLVIAIAILLFKPLGIWSLSFQLSFLATLGIILMLPILTNYLAFLPTNLANAVAIPLAASLWVLPLLGYTFKTIATYGILVNILTTPLISIISLGGMITSGVVIIFPPLGIAFAWLLKYPLLLLVAITRFSANLPGSSWVIGEISLSLVFASYALLIIISCHFSRSNQ